MQGLQIENVISIGSMKLEVNYNFCLFILSNITIGEKGEEEGWEQVNSEVLSTLQPAKKPVSNSKVPEASKMVWRNSHFIKTILSACT